METFSEILAIFSTVSFILFFILLVKGIIHPAMFNIFDRKKIFKRFGGLMLASFGGLIFAAIIGISVQNLKNEKTTTDNANTKNHINLKNVTKINNGIIHKIVKKPNNINKNQTDTKNILGKKTLSIDDTLIDNMLKESISLTKKYTTQYLDDLELKASLKAYTLQNRTIELAIDTNSPDGTMYKVELKNLDKFDIITRYYKVIDKKIFKSIQIPKNWKTCRMLVNATLEFGKKSKHTKDVREYYGKNGENLVGKLVESNLDGEKKGVLKPKFVIYPNQDKWIKKELKKLFQKLIDMNIIKNVFQDDSSTYWQKTIVKFDSRYTNKLDEHKTVKVLNLLEKGITDIVKKSSSLHIIPDIIFVDEQNRKIAYKNLIGMWVLN